MIMLAESSSFWSYPLASAISAIGGILAAIVAVRWRKAVMDNQAKPKDYAETIFDGYEKLIRQQQTDIDRKSRQLDQTQHIIKRLQDELENTKRVVTALQDDLLNSKETNKALIVQLDELKKMSGTNPA